MRQGDGDHEMIGGDNNNQNYNNNKTPKPHLIGKINIKN